MDDEFLGLHFALIPRISPMNLSSYFRTSTIHYLYTNLVQRRRTQIRLAQRAYRQRKETTISALNRRVTSLESTIEAMHKSFLTFNDSIVASGFQNGSSEFTKHLRAIADRLADLARNSTHIDAEEDRLDQILPAPSTETEERCRKKRRTTPPSESDQLSVLGYRTTFDEDKDNDGENAQQSPVGRVGTEDSASSGRALIEARKHYQANTSTTNDAPADTLNEVQQYSGLFSFQDANATTALGLDKSLQDYIQTSEDYTVKDILPFGLMPQSREHTPDKPTPDNQTLQEGNLCDIVSLPGPQSFAFQEASFARRLMRSSCEAAYRLLTSPSSRAEDIKRLCKFSWCYTNSSCIAKYTKNLMKRTANENLELWEVPARHIGGAGLHYPRVGIDATTVPPEWWACEAPTGPMRLARPETPVPVSMNVGEVIDHVGFGGEWFDANDVEQYLRSKGLYLDGHSSMVEVNEDETAPTLSDTRGPSASPHDASSSYDSTGGPQSPPNADVDWQNDPFWKDTELTGKGDAANIQAIPGTDLDSPLGDIDYSMPKAVSPDFDFNMFSYPMPTFNIKTKKFVDVEKFLDSTYNWGDCPVIG